MLKDFPKNTKEDLEEFDKTLSNNDIYSDMVICYK